MPCSNNLLEISVLYLLNNFRDLSSRSLTATSFSCNLACVCPRLLSPEGILFNSSEYLRTFSLASPKALETLLISSLSLISDCANSGGNKLSNCILSVTSFNARIPFLVSLIAWSKLALVCKKPAPILPSLSVGNKLVFKPSISLVNVFIVSFKLVKLVALLLTSLENFLISFPASSYPFFSSFIGIFLIDSFSFSKLVRSASGPNISCKDCCNLLFWISSSTRDSALIMLSANLSLNSACAPLPNIASLIFDVAIANPPIIWVIPVNVPSAKFLPQSPRVSPKNLVIDSTPWLQPFWAFCNLIKSLDVFKIESLKSLKALARACTLSMLNICSGFLLRIASNVSATFLLAPANNSWLFLKASDSFSLLLSTLFNNSNAPTATLKYMPNEPNLVRVLVNKAPVAATDTLSKPSPVFIFPNPRVITLSVWSVALPVLGSNTGISNCISLRLDNISL